jgi:hypothetical protein
MDWAKHINIVCLVQSQTGGKITTPVNPTLAKHQTHRSCANSRTVIEYLSLHSVPVCSACRGRVPLLMQENYAYLSLILAQVPRAILLFMSQKQSHRPEPPARFKFSPGMWRIVIILASSTPGRREVVLCSRDPYP